MKKLLIVIFGILVLAPGAELQADKTGLGIILGQPTGLSFKRWTTEKNALAAGVAWSFIGIESFHLHLDYLWHSGIDTATEDIEDAGNTLFYYGMGGRVTISDDPETGVRIPVGINFILSEAPLDIFIEIVPVMLLLPDTDAELNGGIGIRYWFN